MKISTATLVLCVLAAVVFTPGIRGQTGDREEVIRVFNKVDDVYEAADKSLEGHESDNRSIQRANLTLIVEFSKIAKELGDLHKKSPSRYTGHAVLAVMAMTEQSTYLSLAANEKLEEGSKSAYEDYMMRAAWAEDDALVRRGELKSIPRIHRWRRDQDRG